MLTRLLTAVATVLAIYIGGPFAPFIIVTAAGYLVVASAALIRATSWVAAA